MNPKLLIDAIVRQTTVLIAQVSTAAGIRAPLANLAEQVFLDLSREIEAQGVSRKVAADMFGMALRTYQTRVQRLSESGTDRNRSLWQAILEFVEEHGSVDRKTILQRFAYDEPLSVGAVLNDLTASGFIYRTGSGLNTRFRVTPLAERLAILADQDIESTATLVRVAIYRGIATREGLVQQLGLTPKGLDDALTRLRAEGVLEESKDGTLGTTGTVVPVGSPRGWEAAVFDHYQAVVTAITRKIAGGAPRSAADDVVGGATVSFELTADHPLRGEVLGLLRAVRGQVDALWERVAEHNRARAAEAEAEKCAAPRTSEVVTFYFGQSVQEENGE